MRIVVPKETADGERRVALVPEIVEKLIDDEGFEVVVEAGAGREYRPDKAYAKVGADVVEDGDALYDEVDVVVRVRAPDEDDVQRLSKGTVLVSLIDATADEKVVKKLAKRGVTTISMAAMPRTGQAQSMDAISSMSSIAGYVSVLEAATAAGRYLPMMTTAAGTTQAARVMILGVGVAGLQAIATARRLGAEVEAFDIREEVRDQVKSLGATFIDSEDDGDDAAADNGAGNGGVEVGRAEAFAKDLLGLPREFGRSEEDDEEEEDDESEDDDGDESDDDEEQTDSDSDGYAGEQSEEKQKRDQELVAERIAEMDVVITTALVPGKDAPTLVTKDMVESMKPGAVLLDMAVEAGGNCEVSKPGETVEHGHVKVLGPLNLPSTMPIHASELYAKNVESLLSHLVDDDGELQWDFDDEITHAVTLTHEGKVRDTTPKESEDDEEDDDDDG